MKRRRLLVLACAAACASCAVGPDFHVPAPPANAGYTVAPLPASTASSPGPQGQAQRIALGERIRGDWWTLLHSPALDALVARAMKANPGVEGAQAALRVAQENAAAQRGFFWPTVNLGYAFNRTKPGEATPQANTPTPTNASPGAIYDFHTAQLTVGYAPDVFGGNRRNVESLEAQADAQAAQLEAAWLALAANVTGAAVQEALLAREVDVVSRMVADGESSLSLVQRQWRAGAVSHLDVALQESALAQLRQQLPPLRKQLEQDRDLLRALVGATPDEPLPAFDLDAFELPTELPVALPSQVVETRPDVRAALAQLHAASAQVGVARAARLPQFNLTAQAGGGAMQVASLFTPGARFYSFVAALAQPVFDGGTLRHREAAAQAAYEQAAAQYRGAVLAALQNVADALHAVWADADTLQAAEAGARSSHLAAELTRRQYGHGYLDRIALLQAEQAERQASLALLQARAARIGSTVALLQATAGRWRADGSRGS